MKKPYSKLLLLKRQNSEPILKRRNNGMRQFYLRGTGLLLAGVEGFDLPLAVTLSDPEISFNQTQFDEESLLATIHRIVSPETSSLKAFAVQRIQEKVSLRNATGISVTISVIR